MDDEPTALERRLKAYRTASSQSIRELHDRTYDRVECSAGEVLVGRGQEMTDFNYSAEGWFMRCRYTQDGRRQIVNFLLPGDMLNPEVLAVTTADHDIVSLTPAAVCRIRRTDLYELVQQNADLGLVLWWSSAQEEGILREHIVRVGRMAAANRIAHLLLELQRRLSLVEDIDDQFALPITQVHIADSLGLSVVHVNRAMRHLVAEGAIEYSRSRVQIKNRKELAGRVDFSAAHLHLDALDLGNSSA